MAIYDVFLSLASNDKSAVEKLARKLRDEECLRVYFDQWELVLGTPWQEALEKALADSQTCVVFVGPKGLNPWHTAEMRVALAQRVEKEPKRVIPVLLPGAEESDVPSFLAQRTWVDFRAGLDDDSALARLVAGIRDAAPGGIDPANTEADSRAEKPQRQVGTWKPFEESNWWTRNRLAYLGIAIGILSVLMTITAWLWTWQSVPAIYSVRVQVLDPDGRSVAGSAVHVSAGNEPQLLPDGWWEVEIPAAKVPRDRKVTIWAEHEEWETERADLELDDDPNPRVEVRLRVAESRIRGVVVDANQGAVAGATVSARNYVAEPGVTDRDGRFELIVAAPREKRVRLHVEHPDFPSEDMSCYAGRDSCAIMLGGS